MYYKIDNELQQFSNDRLQFKWKIWKSSSEDIAGTGEQQPQQPGNEAKQQQQR